MVDITEVNRLVDELAKPVFVLRLARGMRSSANDGTPAGLARSAETREANAAERIDALVRAYVARTSESDGDR